MEASILIQKIKAHGLDIRAVDGNLYIQPRDRITDHIRTQVQNLKPALLDFIEAYEERAAIMEFDGGISRQDAEAAAWIDLTKGQTP
ncbi:MAG: hypothetical protein EOM21_17800 [Gammaproteobacteria bacterium]|nr:hypothetical protein [Gammaproteobacteria bacterium]